jgi:hypothetical protein
LRFTRAPALHRKGWTKAFLSDNPQDRPDKWRKRATELRALAAQVDYDLARADLLLLADQWERMANQEEIHLGIIRG